MVGRQVALRVLLEIESATLAAEVVRDAIVLADVLGTLDDHTHATDGVGGELRHRDDRYRLHGPKCTVHHGNGLTKPMRPVARVRIYRPARTWRPVREAAPMKRRVSCTL